MPGRAEPARHDLTAQLPSRRGGRPAAAGVRVDLDPDQVVPQRGAALRLRVVRLGGEDERLDVGALPAAGQLAPPVRDPCRQAPGLPDVVGPVQ